MIWMILGIGLVAIGASLLGFRVGWVFGRENGWVFGYEAGHRKARLTRWGEFVPGVDDA